MQIKSYNCKMLWQERQKKAVHAILILSKTANKHAKCDSPHFYCICGRNHFKIRFKLLIDLRGIFIVSVILRSIPVKFNLLWSVVITQNLKKKRPRGHFGWNFKRKTLSMSGGDFTLFWLAVTSKTSKSLSPWSNIPKHFTPKQKKTKTL